MKSKKSEIFESMEKGECFRNVIFFMKNRGGLCAEINAKSFVVHGVATNIEGKQYPHAWIECGTSVIDPTQGVVLTKKKYYELLQIKSADVKRYPFEEALIKAVRFGHYGPW